MYLWHRTTADEGDPALAAAVEARDAARAEAAALTDRLQGLRVELEARSDRIDGLEASLEEVRGPTLPDGRHFGYLTAVGVAQEPPRLVFDLADWFTDQEAVEAALEDGVPQQDAGINGYYIRNENPLWRLLEIDPNATVTLSTYPIEDPADPAEVKLERFGELFGSTEGYLPLSPYWLTVRDGVVVANDEQFNPRGRLACDGRHRGRPEAPVRDHCRKNGSR